MNFYFVVIINKALLDGRVLLWIVKWINKVLLLLLLYYYHYYDHDHDNDHDHDHYHYHHHYHYHYHYHYHDLINVSEMISHFIETN